ncbi:MAG: hypothetical protein FJY80_03855, partial [Candidatus Aminicenantes bacterium]|nr:hypothetical protein [Candidatus Aminicenantes bacterium]
MLRVCHRAFVLGVLVWSTLPMSGGSAAPPPLRPRSASLPPILFSETGWTEHGEWKAWGSIQPSVWEPRLPLDVGLTLEVTDDHLAQLARDHNVNATGFVVLLTAERTFDADGRFRQANDEKMSTLVTPTGLAIEGGIQGACTNRFGYDWKTPVDILRTMALAAAEKTDLARRARFAFSSPLPADLPPGIYRLRVDVGVMAGSRYYSLNCDSFASRPFSKGRMPESHFYTRP